MEPRASQPVPIGIIGIGMVGSQLARWFGEIQGYRRGKNLFLFDTDRKKKCRDDVNRARIIFVSVPTPRRARDGVCDTRALEAAVSCLTEAKIVVLKSTIPPGTTEQFQKKFPQHTFLFNPEFLTESRAWADMLRPDRQIVGHTASHPVHASAVLNLLPQAYFSSPGTIGAYTFIRVNATEAEMGKYAGNVFGAFKVTYANILADMCAQVEKSLQKKGIQTPVNYENIRMLLSHDHRVGDAWLDVNHNLYRGFGGACFPKDVSALLQAARSLLKEMPRSSHERKLFEKAVKVLEAVWNYNQALLESQGLTVEDVSVHDKEWVGKKLHAKNVKKLKTII